MRLSSGYIKPFLKAFCFGFWAKFEKRVIKHARISALRECKKVLPDDSTDIFADSLLTL